MKKRLRRKSLKVAKLRESVVIQTNATLIRATEDVEAWADAVVGDTTRTALIILPNVSNSLTTAIKAVDSNKTTTVVATRTGEVVVKVTTLSRDNTTSTKVLCQDSIKGLARSVLITLPQVMVGKKMWSRVIKTVGSFSVGTNEPIEFISVYCGSLWLINSDFIKNLNKTKFMVDTLFNDVEVKISARGLKNLNIIGKSDPMCIVTEFDKKANKWN